MSQDDVLINKAITDGHYRYCRALDRMDRGLYDTVFAPGAPMDYDDFKGTAEEFGHWVWVAHEAMQGHSHQIANVLVEVGADGTTAVSEAYVTVCLRTKPDVEGRVMDIVDRGRYLDRWARQDGGGWRIVARIHRSDIRQLSDATMSPPATGIRNRTDPSYDLFST